MSNELIFNNYLINPPEHISPTYRLSPFNNHNIYKKMDKNIAPCLFDDYLKDRFPYKNIIYTKSGRESLKIAIENLKLKKDDIVTIFTTTGNLYISSCVTNTIEKTCKWSRKVSKKTKAILVNHEFGFCFQNLISLKKYRIPIIEDFAYSFNSSNIENSSGYVGDFLIFSLSKFFPIQTGGLLLYDQKYYIKEELTKQFKKYIKNKMNSFVKSIDAISKQRIYNYKKLSSLFERLDCFPYFKLTDQTVPGVFMFNALNEVDLNLLKIFFNDNGVESSVFYGKNAFFIPVHQNLNNNDFNYFFNLMKYFLRHISHDNKKI